MNKKVKIIFICSLLLASGALVCALGYFFASKNKRTEVAGEKQIISLVGRKTYLNSQYGYQIKYPRDWKVDGSGASSVVEIYFSQNSDEEKILESSGEISDGIIISVKDNSQSLSSRDWIKANISADDYQIRDVEDVTINGNPATKISNFKKANYGIYFAREKTVFEILAFEDQKGEEINAIINTFTFTNPKNEQDIIYKVKPGETLSFIASKFNIAWPKLARYNKIKSPDQVYAGQRLKIPSDPNAISSSDTGFSIDLDIARDFQELVDSGKEVWRLDPLEVVKRELIGDRGISEDDDSRIVSEDRLAGQVTIEIFTQGGSSKYIVELVQPIRKGSGGIWMIKSLKSK
jgi:LysM repeat protein